MLAVHPVVPNRWSPAASIPMPAFSPERRERRSSMARVIRPPNPGELLQALQGWEMLTELLQKRIWSAPAEPPVHPDPAEPPASSSPAPTLDLAK